MTRPSTQNPKFRYSYDAPGAFLSARLSSTQPINCAWFMERFMNIGSPPSLDHPLVCDASWRTVICLTFAAYGLVPYVVPRMPPEPKTGLSRFNLPASTSSMIATAVIGLEMQIGRAAVGTT